MLSKKRKGKKIYERKLNEHLHIFRCSNARLYHLKRSPLISDTKTELIHIKELLLIASALSVSLNVLSGKASDFIYFFLGVNRPSYM
jgi:hypothetical protein